MVRLVLVREQENEREWYAGRFRDPILYATASLHSARQPVTLVLFRSLSPSRLDTKSIRDSSTKLDPCG